MMIRRMMALMMVVMAAVFSASAAERQLKLADYRDKMAAAWLGQSFGVAYGWLTEFACGGKLVDERMCPVWRGELINETFNQDDLYVEMTFLATLEKRGLDVTSRAAGIDFANTSYPLWCANCNGRENLRRGIAPPSSSHPSHHPTPDDIDYQIEADYSGIISPGMPSRVLKLGETFGRLMNYGDGLYAGEFVGAMYAEAFFETNRERVVEKALKAIPADSAYAGMVRDVLGWYRADHAEPTSWERTWRKATDKYFLDKSNYGKVSWAAIDVKPNGAMVLIGYLYGEGDVLKTARIATRCGLDSDCNPSTAVGVLGVQLGTAAFAPYRCLESLSRTMRWNSTDYTWDSLLAVSEKLAREIVVAEGGRIEKGADGEETMIIPETAVDPGAALVSRKPAPEAEARYTEAEMAEIEMIPGVGSVSKWAEGPLVKDGEKIAFLGDSITEFGQIKKAGYVNLVLLALETLGYTNVTAVKAGISGHKSNDMLARLDRDVLCHRPQVMTLSCGVNDVWHGARGVPLEDYKRNITEILDKAAASNVTVVVMTSTCIGEDPYCPNNQRLDAYNHFLRSEARRRHLRLADTSLQIAWRISDFRKARASALLPDDFSEKYVTVDGVHMNYDGDVTMAREVLRALGVDLSGDRGKRVEAAWNAIPNCYTISFRVSGEEYFKLRGECRGRTLEELVRDKWLKNEGK